MAGVRRGARGFLKYFTALIALGVVVQVFLAGFGIFGIEEGQALEDVTALDPHRLVGIFVGHLGGLLILIASLLWWPRNKRLLGWAILLGLLLFFQPVLPIIGGQFVGGLHALNAVVLLGLLGYLMSVFWRKDTAQV